MKKYLFFAASALAVVSCSNDDYLGNNDGNNQGTNSAILFDGGTSKTTRATTGATNTYSTASLQTNGFWVYGYKTTGSTDQVVYQNYYLNYMTTADGDANSGQSQTNTKGWEYVGVKNSAYKDAFEPKPLDGNQTIKYWDYSANSYTFFAATAKPEDLTSGKVKITYNVNGDKAGTYTVNLKTGADLSNLYFADEKVINKSTDADKTQADKYGGYVNFQFRNALTKVRVAIFETIPGYSVKINKFYYTDKTEKSDENKFAADVTNTKLGLTETGVDYQVTFKTEDQAVIQPNTEGDYGVQKSYITLGNNIQTATSLGTNSTAATYDNADKGYTWFLAQPNNSSDLKLKVDYTLTSLDGSGEKIEVKGATAIVPADYLTWKNNYAYTYIFKISENTNGSTGGDVKGLYPITFDAAVIETGDGIQETITTVSDPSITTYGKGAVDNEYKINTNIYVSVSKYADGSAIDLNQTNTKLYVVDVATNVDVTEANVAHCFGDDATPTDRNSDGKIDTWTVSETVSGTPYNMQLTTINTPNMTVANEIAADDVQGGGAITGKFMKFKPTAAGTYVFEYIEGSGDAVKKYYKVIKVVE